MSPHVSGTPAIKYPRALLQRAPIDVMAGLVLILFAGFCIFATQNLAFGSSARMGPGFFPTIVNGLIGAFGIAITTKGLVVRRATDPADAMPGAPWRAIIMIMLAILFFAFSVEHLGLFLSGLGMIVLTSMAAPRVKPLEIVVFSILLSGLVTAIFSFGLSLSLPAWPRFG